jgi:hypothetical protein
MHHRKYKCPPGRLSGGLYDTSAMLGDLRVYKVAPVSLELSERPLFVSSHEATVASDISR